MRLAVVVVHYHTPELVGPALAAVRADLAPELAGLTDWLVVDNGSDERGRELLDRLPARILRPGINLGYAGGANLGAVSTSADALLLMNPDVRVLPGCVAALLAALAGGAAAAGPRFYWDDARTLLLPPLEPDHARYVLGRRLAAASDRVAGMVRRRWRRHSRRHWTAREPLRSRFLSGALLLVDRRALTRVGPFDEGYRLYFEERDWLRRAAGAGLETLWVPGAEAVHLYARSSVGEPRSAGWYASSESRYVRAAHGAALDLAARATSRCLPARVPWPPPLPAGAPPAIPARAMAEGTEWVEVSESPTGFPAAACRLGAEAAAGWRMPPEVWERLVEGAYSIRMVDGDGADLGGWTARRTVQSATGEGAP